MNFVYKNVRRSTPKLAKGTIPRVIVETILKNGKMSKKELINDLKKRGITESTCQGRISELKHSNLIQQTDVITVTSIGKRKVALASN